MSKRNVLVGLVVLTMGLVSVADAGDPDVARRVAKAREARGFDTPTWTGAARSGPGASITGAITAAATGLPIASTTVRIHRYWAYDFVEVTTDALGKYEAQSLLPGYYYVVATGRVGANTPYVPKLHPAVGCVVECIDPQLGTPLVVRGTGDVSGIDLQLDVAASIEGIVSVAAPNVMRLAVVDLYDANLQRVAGTGVALGGPGSSTAAYRLAGLPAGSWYPAYRARPPLGRVYSFYARSLAGDACAWGHCMTAADRIDLAAGEARPNVDVALTLLPAGGPRVLDVLYPDATPDDFLQTYVNLYDAQGRIAALAWLDRAENERVVFTLRYAYQLPPDVRAKVYDSSAFDQVTGVFRTYRNRIYPNLDCDPVACAPAAGAPLPPNAETTLTAAGSIRGFITDVSLGGAVLAGVAVEIHDAAGALVASGQSFDDGSYAVGGLADGSYYVATRNAFGLLDQVWPARDCEADCQPLAGTPVAVAGNDDVEGIDFALGDAVFLTGFE